METIGKKIQTLRKNKNMTQAQLAEILSVSSQSVSKWENEISVPDISLLPMIARFFGITMDELFNYRLDALNYKERFIRFMADNGVLQFGEFKLRSGRISPYYINTSNYKSASQIYKLGQFYAECMREHNIDTKLLMGNTEDEIPMLIATSMVLYNKYGMDINYCIDHAPEKYNNTADTITLIKTTLTSGNSLHDTLKHLQENTSNSVKNVIVSVDRMEHGNHSNTSALRELEQLYHVKIHAIVTLDDIIHALETNVIGGVEYLDAIKNYKDRYARHESLYLSA